MCASRIMGGRGSGCLKLYGLGLVLLSSLVFILAMLVGRFCCWGRL